MPTDEEREQLRVKASRFRVPLRLCKANLRAVLQYWAGAQPEEDARGKQGRVQHQRSLAVALSIALEFVKGTEGPLAAPTAAAVLTPWQTTAGRCQRAASTTTWVAEWSYASLGAQILGQGA